MINNLKRVVVVVLRARGKKMPAMLSKVWLTILMALATSTATSA
jgi:uncharacterized membrane protein